MTAQDYHRLLRYLACGNSTGSSPTGSSPTGSPENAGAATAEEPPLRGADIDWSEALAFCRKHGLVSLLYYTIKTRHHEDAVPPETLELMKNLYHANVHNSLLLTTELLKIMQILEEEHLFAIPFKGPALAEMVYGDIALRPYGDLDILVRKEDLATVRELLSARGYQQYWSLNEAEEDALIEYGSEIHLKRDDGKVMVDLHGEMLDRFTAQHFDSSQAMKRRRTFTFSGREMTCLSAEDMLLYLCIHGSKHFWESILWLCDIDRLAGNEKNIDWDWIIAEAKRIGNERMVLIGLSLAREIFHARIPEPVLRKIEKNPKVKKMAAFMKERAFCSHPRPLSGIERTVLFLRMKERIRDRIAFITRFFTILNPLDMQVIALPKPLHFLYYLIRPLRFIVKYTRNPKSSSSPRKTESSREQRQ